MKLEHLNLQNAALFEIFEYSAQKLQVCLRPGRVAHLAIDWQQLYCDPHSLINRDRNPLLSQMITMTQARADQFAQALRPQVPSIWIYHDPVISARDITFEGFQYWNAGTQARRLDEIKAAGQMICGTVDPVQDMVMRKPERDAFEGTTLDEELRARGVDTVLITGLYRHFSYNKRRSECVGQTAASALSRGYNTFIIEDLTVNKMIDTDASRLSAVRMTTAEKAYGVTARDVLRLINR